MEHGYVPVVLATLFFRAQTSVSLGIIDRYFWPILQNTRCHPNYLAEFAYRLGDSLNTAAE